MRNLTGNWYLKKRFWGGYKVMVQYKDSSTCSVTFDEGPEYTTYDEARPEEIVELGIKCV